MTAASRSLSILLVVLSVSKLSTAAVVVCDPSIGPQSIIVGANERVAYTSKNYPLAYPQGSCDVTFYPATPNTKLMFTFEYFRSGHNLDSLDFYANVTDSAPGSRPELKIVRSVFGSYWLTDFIYPTNVQSSMPDFSGIIQTRFNARTNVIAPGFIAYITGYDTSKPFECQSETTVLKEGESLLTVNTGAPFNDVAPATCSWSVKPADANTYLRAVVNYVSLTNGQVLVSTTGQPTANFMNGVPDRKMKSVDELSKLHFSLTAYGRSKASPQLIFGNVVIANQIDFQFSKFGGHREDDAFSYSFVVQAYKMVPPQSNCPSTGMTFDLVGNGANVMKPFYIQTQTDLTRFYDNNQHCLWTFTVSDTIKYVIASYNHFEQLEYDFDNFTMSTDRGQTWTNLVYWNTDYSKQSQLMIKFDSDHIRTQKGALSELRAVPLFDDQYAAGISIVLEQNGVETSIGTPGNGFAIPSGMDLTYKFVSPVGTWVRFRLTNFYARMAIDGFNNFTIYDGASTNSPIIGTINYGYINQDRNDFYRAYTNFFSTQPYMTVRWQSGANSMVFPPLAGIQFAAAGVTNHNPVLPNFNDDSSSSSSGTTTVGMPGSSSSTPSTTTSSAPSIQIQSFSIILVFIFAFAFVAPLM